jgi:hypothetical protein
MRRPPIPQLVLYALVGCLTLAVLFGASTSGAAFGAYNPAWDGTADLRTVAADSGESTVTLSTAPYTEQQPSETVAVVLAPTDAYSTADSTAIRQFVRDGGTLLIADNFGPTTETPPEGNALLTAVGASARFNGALLRDEREYDRAPALPIAANVSSHPYTQGVDQLILNYGTAVDPNGAEPLVRTSPFAYIDRNRSGTLDGNETLQRYPVVTVEPVGDGQVIAAGDPSIFINSMLNRGDNAQFATALFQAHDHTILDYSTSSGNPPVAVLLLVFQNAPLAQALVGGLGVSLIWGVNGRVSVRSWLHTILAGIDRGPLARYRSSADRSAADHTPPLTEAALLTYLEQQYPEWDEDRLRRVVAGIIQEEDSTSDDE